METRAPYTEQVRLLVSLLPLVARHSCFALKGGTAINLFLRDMPRLSVDIDLAYLPVEDRDTSLAAIDTALGAIGADILRRIPRARVNETVLAETGKRYKMVVWQGETSVKIEVTPVLRGSVYPPESRELTGRAEREFGFVRMPVLSFPDLYAGKICAALDRQHPRDLYDVYRLLRHEGIDERLKNAFMVYLMGHHRTMADLLDPRPHHDLAALYETQFVPMAFDSVSLEALKEILPELVQSIHAALTDRDRRFLLAFKQGVQNWQDFPLPEVALLPSVQWKMLNISRMLPAKRREAAAKLEAVLFGNAPGS